MSLLLLLAIAFVVIFLLIKLAARWPRWEKWLVGGLLLLFIPVSSLLISFMTNGRASFEESAPVMLAVAVVMGGLWALVKRKTGWLAGPRELKFTPMPSKPEPIVRTSAEPSAQKIVVDPAPAQPPAVATPQASYFAPVNDRIFISYRRIDSADVTGRIYDRLVQRFGKELIFKDVDSIPLGLDFREYVGDVVGRCNLLLAVLGDQWLTANESGGVRRIDDPKDLVRIEIEAALQRRIPVVPVLVRGASIPEEDQLPPSLAGLTYRNGIKIRSDPDFHRDMDRLIAGMETHLHPRA
jgi:TIR domain